MTTEIIVPTPAEMGGKMVEWASVIPVFGEFVAIAEIFYPRQIIHRAENAMKDAVADFLLP